MGKKSVLIITFLIFAVVGIKWSMKPKVKIETVKLYHPEKRQDYTVYAEAEGQLRPARELYLTVKKGGRLDEILVKEGDLVLKNQFVAVIDQDVRKTSLRSAITSYKAAIKDLKRTKKLLKQGAATQADLEAVKEKADSKRANLEQSKTLLKDGVVRAPIKGRISLFVFNVGDFIPDGSRIGIIEDTRLAQIQVKLPAKYRPYLTPQSLVELSRLNSTKYRKVEGNIKLPSSKHDFDGGYFDLLFTSENLPTDFTYGKIINLRLKLVNYKNVLLVDNSILRWKQGKPYLPRLNDQKRASYQEVKLGLAQKGIVPILNGSELTSIIDPTLIDLEKIVKENIQLKISKTKPNSKGSSL